MKLLFNCSICFRENGYPAEEFHYLRVRDDGLYEFSCSKGHTDKVILQQQRFEILFEVGCHALRDGYTREAVSCFSASLERFYEYYLFLISIKNDTPPNQYDTMWSLLSKQSERQLGAYIYAYTIENQIPPDVLTSTWREFRNGVIHNGQIPEESKALEYGSHVFNLIMTEIKNLKKNYSDEVNKSISLYQAKVNQKTGGTVNSWMFMPTMLNLVSGSSSFEEGYELVKTRASRVMT